MKKISLIILVSLLCLCCYAGTCKVSFVNDNTVIYKTEVKSGKTVLDIGRPIQKPAMAKDFIGWSANGILIFNFATPITADTVFTAIWEREDISNHLYVDDSGTLIGISDELKTASEITIPKIVSNRFVTSIGDFVFMDNENLVSITISDSVKTFGSSVFDGCCNLQRINLPQYMESWGTYVFSGCTSLNSVTIPYGLETIPVGTFRNCSSLETFDIPFGVNTIEMLAFANCAQLREFKIPSSVTKINREFLVKCRSLEKITLEAGNPVFSMEGNCLIKKIEYDEATIKAFGAYGITLEPIMYSLVEAVADKNGCVEIPYYIDTVRAGVLEQRDNLKKVIIKASNCHLVEDTIANCPNLAVIEMPSSTIIDEGSLVNCPKLKIVLSDVKGNKKSSYSIGDIGPSGGIIFFVNDGSYGSSWKYLEMAPICFKGVRFGYLRDESDNNMEIGTYGAVGEGVMNTRSLVSAMKDNAYSVVLNLGSAYAAKICDDLNLMGYDDWFLPSAMELDYIYQNMYAKGVGGLEKDWYWSSTEYEADYAFARDFSNTEPYVGMLFNYIKDQKYIVCPVRAFK